jgi:hypothetical protein
MADGMKLNRSITFRISDEAYERIQIQAAEAGVNISEFSRLKVEDDPREGMRHDLYWGKEFGKSAVALCNIILIKMGVSLDEVKQMLPAKKAELTMIEMGGYGREKADGSDNL